MADEDLERTIDAEVGENAEVKCPRCGSDYLKRMRRLGIVQARIYPLFGYYPWKCTKCLGMFVLRMRSQSKRLKERSEEIATDT